MRRLLKILAAAIGLLAGEAYAQTAPAPAPIAVKAPAKAYKLSSPCTPSSCSGFYGGFNLGGVGSFGTPGQFAGGGMIGGQAGYQFWSGPWFWAVEGFGGYDATSGIAAGQPRWIAGQVVKLGGALAGLLGAPTGPTSGTQSPVPISVPTGLANMLAAPYAQAGAVERSWATGWGVGTGIDVVLVQNWNLDLSYLYVNYGAVPVGLPSSENLFRLGLNYKL